MTNLLWTVSFLLRLQLGKDKISLVEAVPVSVLLCLICMLSNLSFLFAPRNFWVSFLLRQLAAVQTWYEDRACGNQTKTRERERESMREGETKLKWKIEQDRGGYMKWGELTYGRTQSNRRGAMRTFGGYMRQLWTYLISSTGAPECH